MLKKLIRLEFRSTARILGVLYLALIVLSVINRLSVNVGLLNQDQFNFGVFSGVLLMVLYVVCAIATLLFTIFMIVMRFWRNLLENQGYLMHTLPVTARDHLVSKLLVSVVWMIVSLFVFLISVLILTHGLEGTEDLWPELRSDLGVLFSVHGGAMCFVLGVLIAIVGTMAKILQLYAAMSVGQSLSEHRAASSIGAYIGFSVLESVFEYVLVMILGFTDASFTASGSWLAAFAPVIAQNRVVDVTGIAKLELFYLIIPVLYCVVYFALSNYFLKKRLKLV